MASRKGPARASSSNKQRIRYLRGDHGLPLAFDIRVVRHISPVNVSRRARLADIPAGRRRSLTSIDRVEPQSASDN